MPRSKKGSAKRAGSKKGSKKAKITHVINPKTGYKMKLYGPTHMKLKTTSPKHFAELEKQIAAMHGRLPGKGNSNAIKHAREGLKQSDYCGPAGGASATSYPVNTIGRAHAAKAYARFAPNPQGIRDCVFKKWGI